MRRRRGPGDLDLKRHRHGGGKQAQTRGAVLVTHHPLDGGRARGNGPGRGERHDDIDLPLVRAEILVGALEPVWLRGRVDRIAKLDSTGILSWTSSGTRKSLLAGFDWMRYPAAIGSGMRTLVAPPIGATTRAISLTDTGAVAMASGLGVGVGVPAGDPPAASATSSRIGTGSRGRSGRIPAGA